MNEPSGKSSKVVTLHSLTIEHEVYYAVQEPRVSSQQPPTLLVAAHGYGQSCKSFIKGFAAVRDYPVLVAAPQAPNQFYWQRSPPKVGFTWVTHINRDEALANVMTYLGRFLDELAEKYPFDARRVFLLGFSNGAAMMFRLAASGIVSPRGVIACCGDLPSEVEERLGEIEPFSVFIVHGKDDRMVNIDKAQAGEDALRRHGYDVTSHYFEGAHELRREEIRTIMEWIATKKES